MSISQSHELRTPLNAILGFSQLLQRDSSISPQQQETLGIINRSGEHLLELINDVLEISKIEAGKIQLYQHNFDLDCLIDSLKQMFSLKAESKGLKLIVERSPEVFKYIHLDESKLRQVLINLLSNAIKFTKTGWVSLRLSVKPEPRLSEPKLQTIHIEVEDTGVGIAAEELDCLFKPFSQTRAGRQSQEGTGLGLALSYKLLKLMGGDIKLKSHLGKGTLIQLEVPVKEAAEIKVVETDNRQVVGIAPNQPEYRILVVEDKWESRKLLVQLLQLVGFSVQEATNGLETINIWQKWHPNLIFMDIQMPIMDGHKSTKVIRAKENNQLKSTNIERTVIIALTASAFKEEREKIISAGCNDFATKPFRESVIFEKIKQHLGVNFVYKKAVGEQNNQAEDIAKLSNNEVKNILPLLSHSWIEQLYSASLELDEEAILKSIAEIEHNYDRLANTLKNWLENCQLDRIIDCTKEFI